MNEKVSICILTLDRSELTKYCVERSIACCGYDDIEILILDNGSREGEVIHWGEQFADRHFIEKENKGIPAGYNDLFRNSKGRYLCTISNDMLLTSNWLRDMVLWNKKIPNSGITGIHCLFDKGKCNADGKYVPESGMVYSNWLWNKDVVEKIGGLNPALYYGYDDSEYCFRANRAGFVNYYIPWHYCIHCGEEFNNSTEYRKMKDKRLKESKVLFETYIDYIRKTGNIKIPL